MFQDPTVSNVSNCLKYSKMEAVDYDDRLFVRRIQKYRECHIGILSFKRVLQSKWAVIGKIKIKIKTIGTGIPSTEKKKEAVEENIDSNSKSIDDERNEAVASLPTTENIMKHETLNDAKAPEENNEVVSALTTDIMKDVAEGDDVTGDMEVFEADAEGNDLLEFNTEMILDESIDAQGSEAVKGLLDGEFNTELIPDKGGGRKKRQFENV